jgi:hypothetical protein
MRANGLGPVLDDIEGGEVELKAVLEGEAVTLAVPALQTILTNLLNTYLATLPGGTIVAGALDAEVAAFAKWVEGRLTPAA